MTDSTTPTAAIVGDTEFLFALKCSEPEYFFLKTSISLHCALRKLRTINMCLEKSYDSGIEPYKSQLRGDAMEALDDLVTMLEYCDNNGYRLVKN